MNWFSIFTGGKESSVSVDIADKEVKVFCSPRADKALAQRDRPLIVELELAFACFARKRIRFHEASASSNAIAVKTNLALVILTIIPDSCETAADAKSSATTAFHKFIPKWVRIDYVKGKWVGEYGL